MAIFSPTLEPLYCKYALQLKKVITIYLIISVAYISWKDYNKTEVSIYLVIIVGFAEEINAIGKILMKVEKLSDCERSGCLYNIVKKNVMSFRKWYVY